MKPGDVLDTSALGFTLEVIETGAMQDGVPPGAPTPFSFTWDVKLTAAPVGRFVNLYPQQQDGQQQGAPGQRPPPGGRGAPRPGGRPPPRA